MIVHGNIVFVLTLALLTIFMENQVKYVTLRESVNEGCIKIVKKRLTKCAPDAGDSAAISSSFLRLFIFPVGRLRRPCPAQVTQTVSPLICETKFQNLSVIGVK